MKRASQHQVRYSRRPSVQWIRKLLVEVEQSDLAAVFSKAQKRRKGRSGWREIVQLVLIILASVAAMIVGLCLGLAYHD
jgi:predicted PolB exonuclease-like 3'-5' exonuclease